MRDSENSEQKSLKRQKNVVRGGYSDSFWEKALKKPVSIHEQAEVIEDFYFSAMLQVYEQSGRTIPDPTQLVENIKAREKQLADAQKQVAILKAKIKQTKSLQPPEIQSKSTHSTLISTTNLKQQSQSIRKQMNEQDEIIKSKLLIGLNELEVRSEECRKFKQIKNDQIIDAFILLIKNEFKEIRGKISQQQKRKVEQMRLNKQRSQQKFNVEIQNYAKIQQRHKQKFDSLLADLQSCSDERKRLQKQNKQLHTEVYKTHLAVVQKSQIIQRLREKNEKNNKQIYEFQRVQSQLIKIKSQYSLESINSHKLKETIQSLTEDIRETKTENKKLRDEIDSLKRKIEKETSNKFKKVSSVTSLDSIKLEGSEVARLKQENSALSEKIKIIQSEKDQLKETILEAERVKTERMLAQWRNHLSKLVNEFDKDLQAKKHQILKLKEIIKKSEKAQS